MNIKNLLEYKSKNNLKIKLKNWKNNIENK